MSRRKDIPLSFVIRVLDSGWNCDSKLDDKVAYLRHKDGTGILVEQNRLRYRGNGGTSIAISHFDKWPILFAFALAKSHEARRKS